MSDINGGVYPNANGSPIWPGSYFTGPLLAGNVVHSDGTGALAALGETTGTANVGYAQMAQSVVVAAASGTSQTTSIVIPAQSQIISIFAMVTTAQASGTYGLGTTAGGATALTAAGVGNLATLGQNLSIAPATAGQRATWDNVGNTDIQVTITFNATGVGVLTLTVCYLQAINLAS